MLQKKPITCVSMPRDGQALGCHGWDYSTRVEVLVLCRWEADRCEGREVGRSQNWRVCADSGIAGGGVWPKASSPVQEREGEIAQASRTQAPKDWNSL